VQRNKRKGKKKRWPREKQTKGREEASGEEKERVSFYCQEKEKDASGKEREEEKGAEKL